LRALLAAGRLDPDAETVLYNTGDGLKTLDAVSPVVGPTATIEATTEAFGSAVGHLLAAPRERRGVKGETA
jgi:threonine synthase